MRKIALILITLFSILAVSSIKASAAGCSAKCKFSECIIANCNGQYACGCYFGIAVCKCEKNSGGGGSSTTTKMFDLQIQEFQEYAYAMSADGLINLSLILKGINSGNYESSVELYKAAVESLNDNELKLLNTFLES